MKSIKVERLDNNYRVKITVDKIDKSVKLNSVITIDNKPVKILNIKEINSQFIIEAKEFNPCIYVWTTNAYRKSNIYKIGIVNWQSVKERMRQTYTTGVLEPIQIIDTWNLDIINPSITEKIENEIHNTIGLHTKGREAVQSDYIKVIKPTIEDIIKKWSNEVYKEITLPIPRYFQKDAAEIASEYYKVNDKGWIQWTCGSGKSFGGFWIYESVMNSIGINNNIVILLVPNKQLVTQTSNDWVYVSKSYGKKIRNLKVFSDECNDIETFLQTSTPDRINLIVSTYQSSFKVSQVIKKMSLTVDFLINDEVHRLTGPLTKSWSQCLFDSHLPARKRLSMTASPIEYTSESLGFAGMENDSLYGKRFHIYSFLDAQFDGYISPLEVLGIEIQGDELDWIRECITNKKDIIQKNLYGDIDFSYLEEEVRIDKGNPAFFIQLHSTLTCLRDGKFTHPLIYANSIKRIKMFMACLKAMAPLYNVEIDYDEIMTSKDSVDKRIFDLETKFAKSKIGVVGNVYCLQEGISINEVDSVVMVDPRSSAPSIIQILGRPVRLDSKNPNKIANILLPIMISKSNSKLIIDGSYFDDIKSWIINLCASDEDMKSIITDMKILTDKSREGIEVKNVLPIGKKTTISGRTMNLDKKETTYETVDFNDIIFNSSVNVIIDTKKTVNRVKSTQEGIEKTLNILSINYITKFEKEIKVVIDRKYHKSHTNLIKSDKDHISDFSQIAKISKEKSKDILIKNGLNSLSDLTKKLQYKIALEFL